MKPYIFGKRNGIYIIDLQKTLKLATCSNSFKVFYIIDLQKTLKLFEQVANFVRDLAAAGKRVLFVGTKRQAQEAVAEEAKRCGEFSGTNRWPGGTLTNFVTLRTSIERLKDIAAPAGA